MRTKPLNLSMADLKKIIPMKTHLLSLLAMLALAGTAVAFEQPQIYQLKTNDQVLILGDSTTADGVRAPGAYVRLLDQAQHEQIPDRGVVIRALGWGGTCMHDIPRHWMGPFVKPLFGKPNTPTVIILNYGLNDSKEGDTFVPTYLENARKAVAELRELNVTVILSTPTLWGGLKQTKSYAEGIRNLAAELKTPLIDLYAAHADYFTKNTKDGQPLPGTSLTRDGVHFSQLGEEFQARIYLQAFGLKPVWQKFQLRVAATGKGNLTVDPAFPAPATTCKVLCDGIWLDWPTVHPAYSPGTKITVSIEPEVGFTFHGWIINSIPSAKKNAQKISTTIDRHTYIQADIRPNRENKP